jgi:hypothetical protein
MSFISYSSSKLFQSLECPRVFIFASKCQFPAERSFIIKIIYCAASWWTSAFRPIIQSIFLLFLGKLYFSFRSEDRHGLTLKEFYHVKIPEATYYFIRKRQKYHCLIRNFPMLLVRKIIKIILHALIVPAHWVVSCHRQFVLWASPMSVLGPKLTLIVLLLLLL